MDWGVVSALREHIVPDKTHHFKKEYQKLAKHDHSDTPLLEQSLSSPEKDQSHDDWGWDDSLPKNGIKSKLISKPTSPSTQSTWKSSSGWEEQDWGSDLGSGKTKCEPAKAEKKSVVSPKGHNSKKPSDARAELLIDFDEGANLNSDWDKGWEDEAWQSLTVSSGSSTNRKKD